MSKLSRFKSKIRHAMPPKAEAQVVHLYRNLIGAVRVFVYSGDNFYCNCCEKYFGKMRVMNLDSELHNIERNEDLPRDSICPYCGSLPRHRLLCEILKEVMPITGRILLFAPEDCMLMWLKRNDVSVVTTDLFDKTVDVITDIQNMSFEDASFNLIICNHVLQHVPDDQMAILELFRILSPSGSLYLTVAIDPLAANTIQPDSGLTASETAALLGQSDYVRVYGQNFKEFLQKYGFNVNIRDGRSMNPNLNVGLGPAYVDTNEIFVCTK